SQYINALRAAGTEDTLAAGDFARLERLFAAKMDMSWLSGDVLEAQKDIWRQSGLAGMINWYRASPLVVADPGAPIPMPDLPVDRLHVRCPHLLIWGMNDAALLPMSNAGLEAFAPDLTRVEVPDADHWVCHQQPDVVAEAVLGWLDG
ncbi:MAG: alpha/beta hydrolase, partial [Pseudomonadota bacterium]